MEVVSVPPTSSCCTQSVDGCSLCQAGTHQKCQKHRDRRYTAVAIVRLDEDCDRVTCEEVRYREADSPAYDIGKNGIDNDSKFVDVEDILIHD